MRGQREHLSRTHSTAPARGEQPAVTAAPTREAAGWASLPLVRLMVRLLQAALAALIPRRCAACDERCAEGDLCPPCAETLVEAPDGAAALAPFAYGGALAEAVRRAKFRPDERPARALARLFTHGVQERWPNVAESFDVIAWVPLHRARLRTRGFDLAALFASALGRALPMPCRPLLVCTRHDPPLSRGADVLERARRVKQRYRVSADVAGLKVLLIDDVVTTGATLTEASRALLEAGALEVIPLALAATPSWSRSREAQLTVGSPLHSLPRSMRPHMRKSARRDQTG